MSNEELKRYYDMFTDSWRFFKKYSDVKDTDEYWEKVVGESDRLSKQYGNSKFVNTLLLAVIGELERKAREGKGDAKT